MIVVRLYLQPSSFWRRLWYGKRTLRGCTMSLGSEYKIIAGSYDDSLGLYEHNLANPSVHVPKGYQLIVSVSER